MKNVYLCVHTHFYQPNRANPFTDEYEEEPGANPYPNFNTKINAECYHPNAQLGNFEHISFDLGPTLVSWMRRQAPQTLDLIRAAEMRHRDSHAGRSNAIFQPYHHTILPLANDMEKKVQIAWGMADYQRTFGHRPSGVWLPETAVDLATLRHLADAGVTHTLLAPWQAKNLPSSGEPYWVELGDGRLMTAFFYNSDLSGATSFVPNLTLNADSYVREQLLPRVDWEREKNGEPQIVIIATDGELYGHHQPFRDKFLAYLLNVAAPAAGFQVTTLDAYLQQHQPRALVQLHSPSSWSCHHGVARWSTGCTCTHGETSWKPALRAALSRLATSIDWIYQVRGAGLLRDPQAALLDYIRVRNGEWTLKEFIRTHAHVESQMQEVHELLEGAYYRQQMLCSCAFFWEEIDRLEPAYSIASAARAITLLDPSARLGLERDFRTALACAYSGRTDRTGDDLYVQSMREFHKIVESNLACNNQVLPSLLRQEVA